MKCILEFQTFDGDGHVPHSNCEVNARFVFQDELACEAFCRSSWLSGETNGSYKIRVLDRLSDIAKCSEFATSFGVQFQLIRSKY